MRYERSLAITNRLKQLVVLVRRGSFACPTLAEKLGVSEQTVYRDIVFLKRQGYSIRSVRLSNRWAYRLDRTNCQTNRGAPPA